MSTDKNNWNTPIYNAIKAYTGSDVLPFHMPGHKLGKGIPEIFLSEIEKLDLTEIPGMDNLHSPAGIVKKAQELAAAAFGAQRSFFLVNGSTVGLHAAIAAVCGPGRRLIVGRDSHSSVINGMLLAGVNPYYILPEYSKIFGIHTGISPQTVEMALQSVPEAAGVLITRPNYYGVCSDIEEIAAIVHKHDKILIVDEAHGAHLKFGIRLPVCALEAGADLCIQSAHKTLPAFTQGAYLHLGSDRADAERVRYLLDIFQTTSPSYIIMAYLDIAREIMQRFGKGMIERLLDSIEICCGEFGDRLLSHGMRLLDDAAANDFKHAAASVTANGFRQDPTRVTANVSQLGITGYDAEKFLREKSGIQAEMSDLNNIVFIATIADDLQAIRRLFSALAELGRSSARNTDLSRSRPVSEDLFSPVSLGTATPHVPAARNRGRGLPAFKGFSLPDQVMEPIEILNAGTERIPLKYACGKVSKGIVSLYPPGMALICPGETFGSDAVDFIGEVIAAGGAVHGVGEDGTVAVVR